VGRGSHELTACCGVRHKWERNSLASRLAPARKRERPRRACELVVRDRIELSTFRFSEALLPLLPPWTANRVSPVRLHNGWSELTETILAVVPTSAGKCRIVCGFLVGNAPRTRTCGDSVGCGPQIRTLPRLPGTEATRRHLHRQCERLLAPPTGGPTAESGCPALHPG
jgi:hypothetical protein